MSSSALRTFAFVLIILAVIFGVLAYYMNRGIGTSPDAAANVPLPKENTVLAVVAIKPLSAYEEIKREDISLVPISVEPPQYFTDVAEVVGRTPVRGVATGAPVTDEAFGSSGALAQAIPPGMQAMSLSISDVIAVGGFIQPGDFVDVLVYLRSSGDQVEESQARILLKDARVLAYQEKLISGDEARGDSNAGRRERTAVLAIPPDETTRVMLGASLGELRLALRAPVDDTAPESLEDDRMMASNDDAMPERVSPAATAVAMPMTEPRMSDTEQAKQALAEQRVVTLKELARVEKAEQVKPSPPTRRRTRVPRTASATIELYEGSKSSRISRPY
ncbi:Flp pilus assembly protein CpaB [Salinisphaera aquimarina]|uniref:Flp pilus assembly protein CpaB n=1 Tax=Salinisphaera aquimarina TaxID=2094031 RepID=A0ABV7EVP5_9GAMM